MNHRKHSAKMPPTAKSPREAIFALHLGCIRQEPLYYATPTPELPRTDTRELSENGYDPIN
jgi:hypothetical protein